MISGDSKQQKQKKYFELDLKKFWILSILISAEWFIVSPATKSRKRDIGVTFLRRRQWRRLFFLKLYISESINDRMTKISVLVVRDMKLPTNQMTLVLDLLCMVQ